jgi:hypothetical protein
MMPVYLAAFRPVCAKPQRKLWQKYGGAETMADVVRVAAKV